MQVNDRNLRTASVGCPTIVPSGECNEFVCQIRRIVAASLLLPACATVTRGTSQKFAIETTPTEAAVALSTGEKCTSPCHLKLKRKTAFDVTATKTGYEPATAHVDSKVKGGGAAGAMGNVLFGGLIGAAVDGSNGSMKDLTPNPLRMTLNPAAVPVAASAEPVAAPVAAAAAPLASDPSASAVPVKGQ